MEDLDWAEQGRYWDTGVGCLSCDSTVQAYVIRVDGKQAMYGYRCSGCEMTGAWFQLAHGHGKTWSKHDG